jgi:hypothetical protein
LAQAKIELNLGNFHFAAEGEPGWLEKQLDKVFERMKSNDRRDDSDGSDEKRKNKQNSGRGTLSAFLKSADATTNQVKKFLGHGLLAHQ